MRRGVLWATLVAAVLLLGWRHVPESWLDVVTFNTGLDVGYVPLADARAGPIFEALDHVKADLACVQEVVLPEHIDALEAATADKWPTALFMEPDPGEPMEQACGSEFASLPAECLECLEAQVGTGLTETVTACLTQADRYAWGGQFGIGLLTSGKVHASDALVFDSKLSRQGAIYADVTLKGFGRAHVFCIHPTAILPFVPYPGEGSWAQEQAAQVDALLAWVDEKTHGHGRVLILGDFNSGPAGDGFLAEVPQNYEKYLEAGFEDPYAEGPQAACTWCPGNTLVADTDAPKLIDHVMLRGLQREGFGKRVFTRPVTVDAGGQEVTTNLSDHYGVWMRLVP